MERSTLMTKEAAEYLGIRYDKLRSMAIQKKIPHAKIEGRYLFRKDTLDEWMKKLEEESVISG